MRNGEFAMRNLTLPQVPDLMVEDDELEDFSLAHMRVNAEAVYGRGGAMSFVRQMTFDLQNFGRAAERALDLRQAEPSWGLPVLQPVAVRRNRSN